MSSVDQVAAAVHRRAFDARLVPDKVGASSSLVQGVAARFAAGGDALDGEQLAVLFQYVHLFLKRCGVAAAAPFHSLFFTSLSHPSVALESVLWAYAKDLVPGDPHHADMLVQDAMTRKDCAALPALFVRVMRLHLRHHTRHFFALVGARLRVADKATQAVQLLSLAVQQDGYQARDALVAHDFMDALLALLSTTEDCVVLSTGVIALTMVLSGVDAVACTVALQPFLPGLLRLLHSLIDWATPRKQAAQTHPPPPPATATSGGGDGDEKQEHLLVATRARRAHSHQSADAQLADGGEREGEEKAVAAARGETVPPVTKPARRHSSPNVSTASTPVAGAEHHTGTSTTAGMGAVRYALTLFFRRLYAIAPRDALEMLRRGHVTAAGVVGPLMEGLPLHPGLVLESEQFAAFSPPHTTPKTNRPPPRADESLPLLQLDGALSSHAAAQAAASMSPSPPPKTEEKTEEDEEEDGDRVDMRAVAEFISIHKRILSFASELGLDPPSAVADQETIGQQPSHSLSELQSQVLLLRHEMLFERYLRRRQIAIVQRMKRESAVRGQELTEHRRAVEAEGAAQKALARQTASYDRHKQEFRQYVERQRAWEARVMHEVENVKTQRGEFSQQVLRLEDKLRQKDSKIQRLKQELRRLRSRLDASSAQDAALTAASAKVHEYEAIVEDLVKQVFSWEGLHRSFIDNSVNELLIDRDESVADAQRALRRAEEAKKEAVEQARTVQEQLEQKDAELHAQKASFVALRNVLEYQQSLANDRVESVEQKFRSVMEVNRDLYERIAQLQAEHRAAAAAAVAGGGGGGGSPLASEHFSTPTAAVREAEDSAAHHDLERSPSALENTQPTPSNFDATLGYGFSPPQSFQLPPPPPLDLSSSSSPRQGGWYARHLTAHKTVEASDDNNPSSLSPSAGSTTPNNTDNDNNDNNGGGGTGFVSDPGFESADLRSGAVLSSFPEMKSPGTGGRGASVVFSLREATLLADRQRRASQEEGPRQQEQDKEEDEEGEAGRVTVSIGEIVMDEDDE